MLIDDELYHADGANGYDNLNRLIAFQRGALSGSPPDTVTSASVDKSWTLDAVGNWTTVTGETGNRVHNAQNEATTVDGNTLVYDNNGNLTTNENGYTIAYDAWNRIENIFDGVTQLAIYNYDARGWRTAYADAAGTVRSFYYTDNEQVIQEDDNTHGYVENLYVWGGLYVDGMVLRDRDTDANTSFDQRLYVMHDANYNTTGVINTSGTVIERYIEDPYGAPTVIDDDWTSDDNGVSDVNWIYLHQGGRYSTDTLMFYFRRREYDPALGRWVQIDPLRYIDGTNLTQYVAGNPLSELDPFGLAKGDPHKRPPKRTGNRGNVPVTPQAPGSDAKGEDQFQEIDAAQEAAKKKRPSIQDDPEWEGAKKRPKQNTIRDTRKSQDAADQDNATACETVGPDWTTWELIKIHVFGMKLDWLSGRWYKPGVTPNPTLGPMMPGINPIVAPYPIYVPTPSPIMEPILVP